MRSLIATLMLGAMALHAVFGCCVHHAHAHVEENSHSDIAHNEEAESHSCPSEEHAPAPHEDCDEAPCVFAATSRVDSPNVFGLSLSFELWLPAASDPRLLAASSFETTPTASYSPIRTHLLLGVLLI